MKFKTVVLCLKLLTCLINILKKIFKRVIGKSFLNYAEMNTALIDVEQILAVFIN